MGARRMASQRYLSGSWTAVILALMLLAPSFGIVMGQDASDTGEMSVSVLPSGEVDVDTGDNDRPAQAPASAQPRQQGTGSRPGTVSAWVMRQDSGSLDRGDSPTQLVVRDDRGTAAGWSVMLSADGEGSEPWVPFLMENQPGTIVRILPVGASLIQLGELQVGRTLGPLPDPIRILQALPGAGDGLFAQPLTILYPDAIDDGLRLIFVHIASGP